MRGAYQVQGPTLKIEGRLFDVVGSRMVFGKVYEGETRNWRLMVHRFADEIIYALTGERGAFDTKIAYVQAQGKGKEIFVADFDGSNPIQVTRDNSLNLSPAWNSNGTQLAYVSYKEGGHQDIRRQCHGRGAAPHLRVPGPEYLPGLETGKQ